MSAMEQELAYIEEVRAGKTAAYKYLVERYHVGVIIHCERLLRDRDEAEDVAQEAFIHAYTKLASYDASKGRFSTWLYRIATNKCLDILRRRYRQLDVEDIEAIAEATMPTHIEDDEAKALRVAVFELTPPQYRRIIEAYFWEGKSYQEIADELGMSVGNVGVSMGRAKAKLKETLTWAV
jgi:RNA polymerase sigma-70 factor (ECF subfamily)